MFRSKNHNYSYTVASCLDFRSICKIFLIIDLDLDYNKMDGPRLSATNGLGFAAINPCMFM